MTYFRTCVDTYAERGGTLVLWCARWRVGCPGVGGYSRGGGEFACLYNRVLIFFESVHFIKGGINHESD